MGTGEEVRNATETEFFLPICRIFRRVKNLNSPSDPLPLPSGGVCVCGKCCREVLSFVVVELGTGGLWFGRRQATTKGQFFGAGLDTKFCG